MSPRIQAVRGMNDVLPEESSRWSFLHMRARQILEAYGYREIRLPVVERTELFKRAVGETTDVVEKEMYCFEDRSGENLALRPEGTAGCVRAGIEHGLLHHQHQRFWYSGPMFRRERPQAGRYRQFYQIGVEAYGMEGPGIDIEVIALSARLWQNLGLRGVRLQLNSLGSEDTRGRYRTDLVTFLQRYQGKLDSDSQRRIITNPLRILDSKVPATQAVLSDAPSILDYLDTPARSHFDRLCKGLSDLGIEYEVNHRLVRGLDYYTHGVFEWVTEELGSQGTICAGGRYDHLVEQLGGSPTPAVGFATGLERLGLLMNAQKILVPGYGPQVYFCWVGDSARAVALQEGERLRRACPILRLIVHTEPMGLKAQLRKADRSGAQLALILGEDEVAAGGVQVKSLRDNYEKLLVPWPELASTLINQLGMKPDDQTEGLF